MLSQRCGIVGPAISSPFQSRPTASEPFQISRMAMSRSSTRSFAEAAVAAFPFQLRGIAAEVAHDLASHVDDTYRRKPYEIQLLGRSLLVPSRLHFVQEYLPGDTEQSSAMAQCLMSRATDGHLRQSALRAILPVKEAWTIPFIALLIGEYVPEIIDDIKLHLPNLDRDAWTSFIRENRPMMRLLRSRSTSYWNCHHRTDYPDQRDYPAFIVLKQLEIWAG